MLASGNRRSSFSYYLLPQARGVWPPVFNLPARCPSVLCDVCGEKDEGDEGGVIFAGFLGHTDSTDDTDIIDINPLAVFLDIDDLFSFT